MLLPELVIIHFITFQHNFKAVKTEQNKLWGKKTEKAASPKNSRGKKAKCNKTLKEGEFCSWRGLENSSCPIFNFQSLWLPFGLFLLLLFYFLFKEHNTLFSPQCYPLRHLLCPLIIREGTLRFLRCSSADVLCKWRKHLEGTIFLLMFSLNPPVNQISSFLFYVGFLL